MILERQILICLKRLHAFDSNTVQILRNDREWTVLTRRVDLEVYREVQQR